MRLALSYIAVAAVSFVVTFTANRNLRAIDRLRRPKNSWSNSRWASVGPAILSSAGSIIAWQYWGTIVWAGLLITISLLGWSLAHIRRNIEEIPQRPLGL